MLTPEERTRVGTIMKAVHESMAAFDTRTRIRRLTHPEHPDYKYVLVKRSDMLWMLDLIAREDTERITLL